VAGVLAHHGLEPMDATYDTTVHLRIAVPSVEAERVMAELREGTAGQARVEAEQPGDAPSGR
jgi:hypothetical protein